MRVEALCRHPGSTGEWGAVKVYMIPGGTEYCENYHKIRLTPLACMLQSRHRHLPELWSVVAVWKNKSSGFLKLVFTHSLVEVLQ